MLNVNMGYICVNINLNRVNMKVYILFIKNLKIYLRELIFLKLLEGEVLL